MIKRGGGETVYFIYLQTVSRFDVFVSTDQGEEIAGELIGSRTRNQVINQSIKHSVNQSVS